MDVLQRRAVNDYAIKNNISSIIIHHADLQEATVEICGKRPTFI